MNSLVVSAHIVVKVDGNREEGTISEAQQQQVNHMAVNAVDMLQWTDGNARAAMAWLAAGTRERQTGTARDSQGDGSSCGSLSGPTAAIT